MNVRGVLESRVRLARNAFRGRRGGGRARAWFGVALALLLGGIIALSLAALFYAVHAEGLDARSAAPALALALGATLIGLVAFDLHEAVSTLVLDSDLEFLRRAPLTPAAIFALKLLDALPRTSALLVILALPALIAYAISYPPAVWCWLLVPLALLALWATALGLGAAVALLILRVVPARTAREVLGLLSTIAVFALWIANSFLLPRAALETLGPRALLEMLRRHPPPGIAYSPGTWIADFMAAAHEGEAGIGLAWLLLALAAGAAMLLLAGGVAAFNLDAVQARLAGSGSRSARRASARAAFSPRRGVMRAIVARDLELFRRDWTVLGDVLVASALWTLLPLLSVPLMDVERSLLARAMLLALTVALGYEVGTRAIPFERRGLAWSRLAPVTASRWVLARGLSTLAIALPIVAIATFAVTRALALDRAQVWGTVALILPALVLALATGLWTGAVHGNFAWTQPRAMLTLTGRAVATGLLLGQAALWLVVALLARGSSPMIAMLGPLVLGGSAAALLAMATARRLARREW